MYYDENIKLIKNSSDVLYNQLMNESSIYKIDYKVDGSKNLLVNYGEIKSYLHSNYDMDFEMKLVCDELDGEEQILIIFGIGNGYIINYIKKIYPKIKRILVIEPSLDIFKFFLDKVRIAELLSGISVSFLVNKNPEKIAFEVSNYIGKEKINIIHHLSYRTLFSEYYTEFLKNLKDNILVRYGNTNFQSNASKIVMLNFINNIDYGFYDTSVMKEIFENRPLLIVAAGPSLNKNMKLIEKVKGKAIVVAVGSAIRILNENNIIPDFRMAFDPSEKEMKIIKDIKNHEIPFIYTNALYYEILKMYKGPKIRLNITLDSGTRYFDEILSIKNNINISTASSIAVSAVDMGVKFGSSKIIIIGFDGAVYKNEMYAKGLESDNRIESIDELEKKGFFKTNDIYGNEVYTNRGFMMNKLQLEKIVENNSDITFINATEGGVINKGFINKSLNDTLNEDLNEEFILDLSENIFTFNKELHLKNLEIFLNKFNEDISMLYNEIDNYISLLRKIKEFKVKDINKIKRELIYIRKRLLEIKQISFYKNIIQTNLNEIIRTIENINRSYKDDELDDLKIEISRYLDIFYVIQDYLKYLEMIVNAKNKLLNIESN